MLFDIIRRNDPNLTELSFVNDPSSYDWKVQDLVELFDGNTTINSVHLDRDFIPGLSPSESIVFFESLGRLSALKTLKLANGVLPVAGLAALVKSAEGLEVFNVGFIKLQGTEEAFSEFELSLRRHHALQEFVLDKVSFDVSNRSDSPMDCMLDRIVLALKPIRTLQVLKLNVSKEQISACYLAPVCCTNRLRELHLQGIDMQALHFGVIAYALKMPNSSLKVLSLKRVNVNDEAAERIAAALISKGNSLHELDLSWNDLTGTACEAIANSIANHPTLETLRLWGCKKIGSNGLAALAKAMESNKVLKLLETPLGNDSESRMKIFEHLRNNRITDSGKKAALAA